MANYYIYFISSLPMLHFDARPPFSFARFLQMCEEFIPQEDVNILKHLPKPQDYQQYLEKLPTQAAISGWVHFDTALRNELVKLRSSRRHIDPSKYLRPEIYSEPSLAQVVLSAYRNPALIEGEKILDQLRWNFLDGLCFGHYFDLDFLIIYGYKLLILERWERVRSADKTALLEKALGNQ